MQSNSEFYGVGIYSIAEAARLTDVSSARIRRWIRGYTFKAAKGSRASAPVWHSQLPVLHGRIALSFLDLIEVRFVNAFLQHGVRWPTIRLAESHARELFKTDHPFAANRFKTDGRGIFADIVKEAGDNALIDLANKQYAFRELLAPYFLGLDFEDGEVARWWPLGQKRRVVLDPNRSFGQPIISKEGVATATLAHAFEAERSEDVVARWYRVDVRSVRDALEFEKQLAA